MPPDVTFTADDFGLTEAVNEAVERAHVDGVLDAASLMVAGPAAADAVARAKRRPSLRVGLHVVAVQGASLTRPAGLTDAQGTFPHDQAALAFRMLAHRAALRAEVAAQFAAFAATGLPLRHADAHKHMHMHPVVAAALIGAGRAHGLARVRVPAEPPGVMAACGTRTGLSGRAMYWGSRALRARVRAAGLATTDRCFGIAWSGQVTAARLVALAGVLPGALPGGTSEVYAHPATRQDAALARLMPGYDPVAEFAALCDPAVRRAFGR